MSASKSVDGEAPFPRHLRAVARLLIRSGVWLSAIGAVCAGGGYLAVHSSTPPDNFYPGVIGRASVVVGFALLIFGLLCRGIARLWKISTGTA
jgi:hypothetical protein